MKIQKPLPQPSDLMEPFNKKEDLLSKLSAQLNRIGCLTENGSPESLIREASIEFTRIKSDLIRFQNELTEQRSGIPFWQRHDIDAYAQQVIRSSSIVAEYLRAKLPTTALIELERVIQQITPASSFHPALK